MRDDAQRLLAERGVDWLRTMIRIRAFEEALRDLYKPGLLVGIVHLSIGQEAAAVGVCTHLKDGDQITSTHRGHHHMLARGLEPRRMFAEILARDSGYCHGKGGSMHVSSFERGAVGANGIVGGGIPMAVGVALAAKLRGADNIAVAFFGDGAANQGVLYESLNLAALWSAPIVFVCENNGYSEFTPADAVTRGPGIASRGDSFGVPSVVVDGDSVADVAAVAGEAIARARGGGGPTFVEARTTRWRGHHEGEESYAGEYRDAHDVVDPIDRLEAAIAGSDIDAGMSRSEIEAVEREDIGAALAQAQEDPEPTRSRAREDVYA